VFCSLCLSLSFRLLSVSSTFCLFTFVLFFLVPISFACVVYVRLVFLVTISFAYVVYFSLVRPSCAHIMFRERQNAMDPSARPHVSYNASCILLSSSQEWHKREGNKHEVSQSERRKAYMTTSQGYMLRGRMCRQSTVTSVCRQRCHRHSFSQ
jgi:hypothetical protein